MKEEKTIIETIKHWEHMLSWAKEQKKTETVYNSRMLIDINKLWNSDNCTFCREYKEEMCIKCPLFKKYGLCESYNVSNLWESVNNSITWGEWVINAEKFLKQLKSLRGKDEIK